VVVEGEDKRLRFASFVNAGVCCKNRVV
jgi:hypothetical protein